MSIQLLDKTRKINNLLQNNISNRIVFDDLCNVLSEILNSNVLVISKKGKLLGFKNRSDIPCMDEYMPNEVGRLIDAVLNDRLLNILSTKENVNLTTIGFDIKKVKNYQALITPINISDFRLGTLFLYRNKEPYSIEDIILSEYGAAIIGMAMMQSEKEENDEEKRKVRIVRSAIATLSYSELEAVTYIFQELDGKEGILVASKVADKVGITRSVIVNGLRKFESAGVIKTRSSGMKGTYIEILNDVVLRELNKANQKR